MTKIFPHLPPSAAQCRLARLLFVAIEHHNLNEVFRLAPLIEELDRHTNDFLDETPLLHAARQDLSCSAFKLLLARSDPRKKNSDNATALILAAWGHQPHTAELVRLLLPLSDPLAPKKDGGSALHCAIEVADVLLAAGNAESLPLLLPTSDLTQRNHDGLTPLEFAQHASERAVTLILGEMARRDALDISRASAPAVAGGALARRL